LSLVTVKYSLHYPGKPYYTKIVICWLSTVDILRQLFGFSNVLDFNEAVRSITLSRVKIVFWFLPQLDILCTSAVKCNYAKNYNLPSACQLVSSAFFEVHGSKKTCHRVVWILLLWLISFNLKSFVAKIVSEILIIW